MSLRRCFLYLCCCALILPRVASGEVAALGPRTEEMLSIDTSAQSRPNDDCVILYRGVEIVLDRDGRASRRVRQVERLLTDAAIAHRGDRRVALDRVRQDLIVNACRTFMRDGREVPALPRAFNWTTPERVSRCPNRTCLQEIVISPLGVERGCLVELDYTVTDRVAWRPWLEGAEAIGDDAAVLRAEIAIEIPAGSPFHAAAIGEGVGAGSSPRIAGDRRLWSFSDIPATPDEGGMTDLERLPHLVYSTCQDWDHLVQWIDGRINDAAVPDTAIAKWMAGPMASGRLPLGSEDRLDMISWLLRERTNAADDPDLDWFLPVQPASRTFETSCGNMLDRTALAVAAARASSLGSRIALRPAVSSVARDVPALLQFDELLLGAGRHELAAREGIAGPMLGLGVAEEVLELAEGSALFRPLAERWSRGRLSVRLHQDDDDGIVGEAALSLRGGICRTVSYTDLKSFLDGLVSGLAEDASLAGYRVDALGPDTLALTLSLTGKALGDSISPDTRVLSIPSVPGMPEALLPTGVSLSRVERRSSLRLPFLIEEEVSVLVELPETIRPIILPSSGRFEGGGCSLETEVARDGGAIRIRRKLVTKERTVSPGRWADFRAVALRRIERGANGVWLKESDTDQ